MPRGVLTVLVVPGPNGRGEVQVTPSSKRHHDRVSSEVRSAHTASAGRPISIVSTMRSGAELRKFSSPDLSLNQGRFTAAILTARAVDLASCAGHG